MWSNKNCTTAELPVKAKKSATFSLIYLDYCVEHLIYMKLVKRNRLVKVYLVQSFVVNIQIHTSIKIKIVN